MFHQCRLHLGEAVVVVLLAVFFVKATMATSTQATVIIPQTMNVESEEMMWSKFAKSYHARTGQKICSSICFHTGTTTSVRKSTIRTTLKGEHLALVMQGESEKIYVAISKAQGCTDSEALDPNFIGWVRRYDEPFLAEAWDRLDDDVDGFYQDACGEELNDSPNEQLDDETFKSRCRWRPLVMRARPNSKGECTNVYETQIDEEDYTLLNKGARFLQTGTLEALNPPKAKSVRQDEKVEVKWMWFDGAALHFCDQKNVEFSIRFGELVCFRHDGAHTTALPVWCDKNGLVEPFSKKYFPTGFVEHIAGRRYLVLPVSGVKCRDEDRLEDAHITCHDIDPVVKPGSLDKMSISWRQGRWISNVVVDRRDNDGIWAIVHVECRDRDDVYQQSASVGIHCGERTWLWFYVLKVDDQGISKYVWWKCPWQIIEIFETHIKGRRRRMREGELVREVEDQVDLVGDLFQEVADQAAPSFQKDTGRFLCWMCGDRPFNARHQLVDHIEGAGAGGKSHLIMRKRWIENGQMMREDWLDFLEKTKTDGKKTATPSSTNVAHVAQRADCLLYTSDAADE